MKRDQLEDTLALLEETVKRRLYHRLDFFIPYPKQEEFFVLGATKRERLLSAGNQQGKTEAGAYETACHLTGQYPTTWKGRRFDKPVNWWVCAETGVLARDGPQRKLYGEPSSSESLGTGYIPRDCIPERPSLARGVTDAFDTGRVRHISGGESIVNFKSYDQGRTKFQGSTLHGIWADEEPPIDVYSEMLARISATRGIIYTTFTPLLGMSKVVRKFYSDEDGYEERGRVTMTIEDALHIPAEERAKIIAGYEAHERDARVRGIPMMGEGLIFKTPEDQVRHTLQIADLPSYWFKLWGIDFGIAHPFAAVLMAWDKDNDVLYVMHAFKRSGQREEKNLPLIHAAMMRPIGAAVPVAWPQDGTQREKSSGEPLAAIYRSHGLLMLPDHATWPDGSVSTEAGVTEMNERFTTGRLKVAAHLAAWFDEYRLYHRKKGEIVKIEDDLLSATRVAIMMRRFARQGNLMANRSRRIEQVAADVDFDLF